MKYLKIVDKSRLIAIKKGKVLVLEKRGPRKRYSLPGGVTKKKESKEGSLVREVKEEVGISLLMEKVDFFLTRIDPKKNKIKTYKHYYVALSPKGEPKVLEPHKFKGVHWITWYECLDFLDREDRSAVALYFDQFQKKVNGF
ncbi:NUDIX hydrolase [Sediminicola luteus]|uniref:Nudix hydrolase domain-containing protein n=1 Tax=Sediminicola luteus TaxID=319238 RepID=A0A2A4G5H2_9FLAO|nr:NUDIX hydrolase [Sediminicola luteus]PCE62992.1 hypothetical protein B7P33_17095 [Sediminicola luteus]